MSMFSRFMPSLQATMMGQIPGAISEMDPRLIAAALDAPVPAEDYYPTASPQALPPLPLPPLNVTPPERYGMRPSVYGGGPMGDDFGRTVPPEARLPDDAPMNAQPMYGEPSDAAYPDAPKKRNGVAEFFTNLAGYYGDALTGNPIYSDHMKTAMRRRDEEMEEWRKSRMPQQVGQSLIQRNAQGGYDTLYRHPSVAEEWALARGFKPGTEDFQEAVRQYRLGSWSDDAVAAKTDLTGYRYDRMGGLQEDRQDFSQSMQEDRQQHSNGQLTRRLTAPRAPRSGTAPKAPSPSSVIGRIMDKQSRGQPLSAGEQKTYDQYYARRGGGGRPASAAADMIGPVYQRGGRRIQFSKKVGAYVDLATGQRVK